MMMLKLSDREFEVPMNNMLKILMGKEGNMQDQTGTFSREMETVRKRKKLEFKYSSIYEAGLWA